MVDNLYPDKRSNGITMIDIPNDFSGNVQVRNVELYDETTAFHIGSTSSNSEDSMIIFLDSNQVVTREKFIEVIINSHDDSSYFERFKDIDQCIDFISSLKYEKIFLILFLREAAHLIPLIHNMPQLVSVYICIEREDANIDFEQLNWITDYPIIHGRVHKLNDELFQRLKTDMKSVRSPLVNSTFFSMKTKTISVQALNTEQASYQWNQLLLNALQKLSQNDESKQDILSECKAQYHDDQSELKKIEQFEKTYQPQLAVWWYTQDSFLYKLINKALQTEDIDIIFKFRFFIIDLYNQLINLHNQSKSEKANILTVYRGQQVATDELEALKLNINSIISLKSFLSTTTNKNVALIYAGNGSDRPQFESVLFKIIIDVNKSHKPLADISKISQMSDEDEVLLSMSMLFTVNSVDKVANTVWEIQLTSVNETDIEVNDYYKYLNTHEEDDPLLRLATLLLEMTLYDKAEKYLRMLLEEVTDKYPLIYNKLGLCYFAKHNYRRALKYYTMAINHFIMLNCSTHSICCYVYNNIALVYEHEENYEEALRFYNKALEINLQCPTKNTEAFITTLTNLATIYAKFGNYNEALEKNLHALEIVENSHFKGYPVVASIYKGMGYIYLQLGQHDKAMENFKIALRIHKDVLQNDALSVAGDHISIGRVHEFKAEYDDALHHYKQAEKVLQSRNIIGYAELAGVYGFMGVVYRKKRQYNQALHYHKECLKIHKQFHSKNSTAIATTYGNIGTVYRDMGDIEKAVDYTKKAIVCIKNCRTTDDLELAYLYNNIALDCAHLGHSEQALYYNNLALNIKRRFFPENHRTVAVTFSNIAQALVLKGDIQMAIDYQEKALKIFEDTIGINHPDCQICMMGLNSLRTLANYNRLK